MGASYPMEPFVGWLMLDCDDGRSWQHYCNFNGASISVSTYVGRPVDRPPKLYYPQLEVVQARPWPRPDLKGDGWTEGMEDSARVRHSFDERC